MPRKYLTPKNKKSCVTAAHKHKSRFRLILPNVNSLQDKNLDSDDKQQFTQRTA